MHLPYEEVASQAIRDMFHLVHGPRSQHGKLAVVIAGYFDESNSHAGAKVLTLCGFLADPRIWSDLDQEWNKILDKPCWPNRPREFHMVDCVHGTKDFDGWKLPERLAIYGDMVGLLCETNLIAIGSGIVIEAYESLSAEHKALLARGGFLEPLDLVFQCDLQFAIDATVNYGKTHTPPVLDDLGLIFDESPADVALQLSPNLCTRGGEAPRWENSQWYRIREKRKVHPVASGRYTRLHYLPMVAEGAPSFDE